MRAKKFIDDVVASNASLLALYAQGREGQTLKWVKPLALRDYPMPPADEPLIPILQDLL